MSTTETVQKTPLMTVQPRLVQYQEGYTFTEDDIRNAILVGHALALGKQLPKGSIRCIVTSPPYWNKRNYGTPHQIWGGKPDCQHEWNEHKKKMHNGRGDAQKSGKFSEQESIPDMVVSYADCMKCGAWKGELGQEKDYMVYISHLADVFDPLYHALADDGTCFINLGDSMTKDNQQANIPILFSEEMKRRGWKLRRVLIWQKPNGMPGSDGTNFTIDYEYILFFVKQKGYFFQTQFKPYAPSTLKEIIKDYTGQNTKDYASAGAQPASDSKRSMIESIRAQIKFGGNRAEEYGNPMYSGNVWQPLSYGAFMRSVWKSDEEYSEQEAIAAFEAFLQDVLADYLGSTLNITTKGTSIKHYAAWPAELCAIPIRAGCPTHICQVCGTPRKKTYKQELIPTRPGDNVLTTDKSGSESDPNASFHRNEWSTKRMQVKRTEDGYLECTCENKTYKKGIVLDPFGGTGMTAIVASQLGCDYTLFELKTEYANDTMEHFKAYENKSVFKQVKKA